MSTFHIFIRALATQRRGAFTARGYTFKDGVTALLSLWNLLFTTALLRLVIIDSLGFAAPTSPLAVMLLMIYGGGFAAHVLGMLASAASDRLHHMRADLMSSLLCSLSILLAAMVRAIVHTALSADLIGECTALAIGIRVLAREGIWGPALGPSTLPLSLSTAENYCDLRYAQDSVFELGALALSFATTLGLIGIIVWENTLKDREDFAKQTHFPDVHLLTDKEQI